MSHLAGKVVFSIKGNKMNNPKNDESNALFLKELQELMGGECSKIESADIVIELLEWIAKWINEVEGEPVQLDVATA